MGSGLVGLYYVVTEGVRLTQQYACLRSASTSIPGRRKLEFVQGFILCELLAGYPLSRKQLSHDATR